MNIAKDLLIFGTTQSNYSAIFNNIAGGKKNGENKGIKDSRLS